MSQLPNHGPLPAIAPVPSQDAALRRLFLTLFLRGRTSRGLLKGDAPTSVAQKLASTLCVYALMGLFAMFFRRQPVFGLSVYLHSLTFMFLGMFVAASAGEVLFNKEEADILLHRPVAPGSLLRAKIRVILKVSLWLAGSFNLAGLFVGVGARDGGWLFPWIHALSITLEALFCACTVVLAYQLCLRWFGRERLDGLMTTVQVIVAVAAVLAGQLLPQFLFRFDNLASAGVSAWWIALLPPAWFAGLNDAVAGSGSPRSWGLAVMGLVSTPFVLWLSISRLAQNYGTGLNTLNESKATNPKQGARRRWLHACVNAPPLCWWLRSSVERAAFLLSIAYLFRDRDVKLRIYPGLAPMLVIPVIFMIQDHRHAGAEGFAGFGIAFTGTYLGLVPMLALSFLQYSQQWQASDIFRIAPIAGPAPLCNGARKAVIVFFGIPLALVFGLFASIVLKNSSQLPLLLPGLIALPIFTLVPCLNGVATPLSQSIEEAKSARRGLVMIVANMIALALAVFGNLTWSAGCLHWFLMIEALIAIALYRRMRASISQVRWHSAE